MLPERGVTSICSVLPSYLLHALSQSHLFMSGSACSHRSVQEPVVRSWEVARGVRDAEDEELSEYYLGMTPNQV